jgi:branched-chain amino acid transport system substrate-binding protein
MKRRAALSALALPLVPFPALAQSGPIKIGLTVALSGPFANTVAEYLPAFQLGADAVNAGGGIRGRKVQLLIEDSQGTPQGGIAGMRKLTQVDGVVGMLTIFTNVVTAQIPLAEQLQMPTVGIVEAPNVVNNAAFVFAHGARTAKADALFREYWKAHGFKRIYAFLGNNATGQVLAPSFRDNARAAGADAEVAFINLGDADYRGELTRAREWKPDAFYFNTSGAIADSVIIRQARELGLNQQFFTSSNFYTTHGWRIAAGPYTEGMIFGGPRIDVSVPVARDFVRAYRTKMGFEPGYAAGTMFDAPRILCWGIEHASGGGVALRDTLAKMSGVTSSLGGELSMGPDHYTVIPSAAVWQVRHGVEVKVG